VRDGLDFGGAADGLVRGETALAVHEVRGEDSVDERRLAEPCLACTQSLLEARTRSKPVRASLPTQMMLNWKPRFTSFFSICAVMLSKPTWLVG
jgi:hypothetical protein